MLEAKKDLCRIKDTPEAVENFQKECYRKYVIREALQSHSCQSFLDYIHAWQQNTEKLRADMPLSEYLIQSGAVPGIASEKDFLEGNYRSGRFMYQLLSDEEFQTWVSIMQPRDEQAPSMPYIEARMLVDACIEHGIIQDTQAVYVFAVSSDGTDVANLVSKDDAVQDIMRNPEGQVALTEALKAKGVTAPAPVLP